MWCGVGDERIGEVESTYMYFIPMACAFSMGDFVQMEQCNVNRYIYTHG